MSTTSPPQESIMNTVKIIKTENHIVGPFCVIVVDPAGKKIAMTSGCRSEDRAEQVAFEYCNWYDANIVR